MKSKPMESLRCFYCQFTKINGWYTPCEFHAKPKNKYKVRPETKTKKPKKMVISL